MNTFRKYLILPAAALLCLLFAAGASWANTDRGEAMSFEQAVAYLDAVKRAEERLFGLMKSMEIDEWEADSSQTELFEHEAEALMAPFMDVDPTEVASALLGAEDSIALERVLNRLSVDALSMLLTMAAWEDFDLPQHNVPFVLALLNDQRDPLDTLSLALREIHEGQLAMRESLYGPSPVPESVAASVWDDVLRILPVDVRSNVVIAVLEDAAYPLINDLLIDALEAGSLKDLELEIDMDWLLGRIAEDRTTWLPLLIQVAGEEQMHLVVEQMMDLPESQQIRALARRPDAGLQADLERLGHWLQQQDGKDVDAELVYQLATTAVEMDSRASMQWLEDTFFELPHSDEVSGRLFRELSWRQKDIENALSPAFTLRLAQSAKALGTHVEQIVALHEHDASATRALVVSVLAEEGAGDHFSVSCEAWLAHAYLLATDSSHIAPDLFASEIDRSMFCSGFVIGLADSMGAASALDWVLDAIAVQDSSKMVMTDWQLASMKHDDLRQHAVWRLQGTTYWESLDTSSRQRIEDPDGYRAQRATMCAAPVDSDL